MHWVKWPLSLLYLQPSLDFLSIIVLLHVVLARLMLSFAFNTRVVNTYRTAILGVEIIRNITTLLQLQLSREHLPLTMSNTTATSTDRNSIKRSTNGRYCTVYTCCYFKSQLPPIDVFPPE